MDYVISFTPAQLIGGIIGICGAITCVSAAITAVIAWVKKAKNPDEQRDERIASLEKRIAKHDELFARDNDRLELIEEGNRITQRAILALLSHGIDGNDIDALKSAKIELQNYLIQR